MAIFERSDLKINPRIRRRDLLIGMIGAGGAAALATLGYRITTANPRAEFQSELEESVPFYGIHQAGIVTPAPASGLIVALDLTVKTRADLITLFQTLTQRIEFLTKGGALSNRDPRYPPNDSGLLGTEITPDNLTITVAVGASLFDQRFGLSHLKPVHLIEMPGFQNDRLDPSMCHGDLLLQFCANHVETNLHALRDIIKQTSGAMLVRWKIEGFLQPNILQHPNTTSVRNMLGFKDGTANLNPDDDKLMNRLVWVQPKSGEPDWTIGGTYQVVRVIRNLVERWDRTPLGEQEQIIGRYKDSGAPLGMRKEQDEPGYTKDPKGKQFPLDAHIRLANPRTTQTEANRILRRGFNYTRSVDAAGQLDMGLLFVCFQSDLSKGFITVQKRLAGEALEEYIKPIGGGFFFALPGVSQKGNYLGQSLLEAA